MDVLINFPFVDKSLTFYSMAVFNGLAPSKQTLSKISRLYLHYEIEISWANHATQCQENIAIDRGLWCEILRKGNLWVHQFPYFHYLQ